jgi:hypothetical protein
MNNSMKFASVEIKNKKRRNIMKIETPLKKFSLWLLASFAAVVVMNMPALASTDTVHLDIHVSINASKSLALGTTSYNFGAMSVNTSSVSASAIVVTNDSAALQETYTVQGANATGGNGWTLASSTGTIDQYVLGVQFASSQPSNDDTTWASSRTTVSAVACSNSQFAGDQSCYQVPASGATTRNLWLRMITPLYVSDTVQKNATITLAVQ